MKSLPLKTPSALIPPAMSLAALALVLGHAAIFGIVRQADEGTAAHVFQLLMVAQLPVAAYFAAVWGPRRPRAAVAVLALQAALWLTAIGAVVWLESM